MEDFFANPDNISFGVLIVDSRHKPTADDITMADWFKNSGCEWIVLANKIDKLKKSEIEKNLELIRSTLNIDENIKLIPFSAEKGEGRELLVAEIMKLC